jgi:hypothetical protein
MISYVMNLSSSADSLESSKLVLDKANGVVVSVRSAFYTNNQHFGATSELAWPLVSLQDANHFSTAALAIITPPAQLPDPFPSNSHRNSS